MSDFFLIEELCDFAVGALERIGMVCPGGSLMGASVILLRLGEDCSASIRLKASATKSRSDEPRFTAAILARFMRSSGRSKVVRINMLICFPARNLNSFCDSFVGAETSRNPMI